MSRLLFPLLILFSLIFCLAACSDDPATPPDGGGDVAAGTLDPAGTGFEIELEFASGPDSLHRGPFLLRGGIPVWSERFQGLVVELTITNNGEVSFADPISILFFRMIPDSIVVMNLPEGSQTLEFEFANDDGVWTPGEESLPLMVVFSADPGQSEAPGGRCSAAQAVPQSLGAALERRLVGGQHAQHGQPLHGGTVAVGLQGGHQPRQGHLVWPQGAHERM